jgi:hypothetical protein
MITIAGGTYIEHCMEPEWDRLFGSGLRAAEALAKYDDVHLVTVVGSRERPELEELAAVFEFRVTAHASERTISFSYPHCLSDPRISPRPDTIRKRQLDVQDDVILCYGMLDADVSVCGRTVVYDPQGPQAPVSFRSGERSAEHLAVVANVAEARRLAGESSIDVAASKLLERERADVVVVKLGPRGAVVATRTALTRVPAYDSKFAWTLGSGDLFAAAFTEFWAHRNLDPAEATDLASRAVSLYADRRALPTLDPNELLVAVTKPLEAIDDGSIYLAGPFFTLTERWLIEESHRELRRLGLTVNSPLHDVGFGPAETVAERDLELLRKSDRVFAILDGGDPGTLFEVGYARDRGMPVIAFAQNVREEDLKMVRGTGCRVFDDFPTAIATAIKKM